MSSDAEEVLAECSDEEEYNRLGTTMENDWSLTMEDLLELYEKIAANKMVEFSWKCPGRREPGEEKPSDEVKSDPTDKKEPLAETENLIDPKMFDEDSKLTLRPTSGKSTPKGSAKKKTTSFASIVSNMERHHIIQMPTEHARSLLKPDKQTNTAVPTPATTSSSTITTSTSDSISDSIDRVLESNLQSTKEDLAENKETTPDASSAETT